MRSNTADFFTGSFASSCREGGASDPGKLCLSASRAPGNAGLKGNLPVTSHGLRMVYFFCLVSVGRTLQTSPPALSPPAPRKIATAACGRPTLQITQNETHSAPRPRSLKCIPCPQCGFWTGADGVGETHTRLLTDTALSCLMTRDIYFTRAQNYNLIGCNLLNEGIMSSAIILI